ncbi:uncharacterized protein LOC117322030 [Pecten maximus]|uniref:uncharacterized protein LOC117322030 n=1 Tax=Pecten maximus TaxID=6579 RepID=UPI0014585BFE|nr:uncharacterized protein LOC117322030 [Pecten maximus]
MVKEEPVMDGYPDTSQSEMTQEDNLFVSTEHGKMFLRTASTEPSGDNGKESEEIENDDLIDKLYLEGRGLHKDKSRKFRKKNKILEEETDGHHHEQMPGRIIGHDESSGEEATAVLEKGTDESPEQDLAHLYREQQRTKAGKSKKMSSKLVHNSPKKRKILEQGTGMLGRKRRVVSPARSSSPVSGDDMVPEDEVSYNLRCRPADKEVGSATNDLRQVDLSLVKTEPIDHSELDQGSTVTDAEFNKTDSTSWIKKEPFTEDGENLTENAMETNVPVPVKLIRNEVVNSGTPESGMENRFEDLNQLHGDGETKSAKNPASLVMGGRHINLQSGQKIWYALPNGDKSALQIGVGGDQKKIVKVIKLNNIKNGPNTVPLTGNLKLLRLKKAPNMSSCQGKEIPLSSVLNHKNVTLVKNTTDSTGNKQGNKDLMLKKIDGIIKENLELMKKNQLPARRKGYSSLVEQLPNQNQQLLGPQWREEIDEETGKTTMVLMPTQEKKDNKKAMNTVIYRYEDRSKCSGAKKYQKVIGSSQKLNISSTPVIMLRQPVKVKQNRVVKKPAMCNSFTQTKEDLSGKKKLGTGGNAMMVKDASMQTETCPGNAEAIGKETSTKTQGIGSGDTSTNPVGEVSDHSEETDLLMDVEDVDFINLENKSALDPLAVPRPVWKWNSREMVSIGVNTYEGSVDESNTPLHHEYAIAPSKDKPKYQTYVTGRSKQCRSQWMKVNKMQKLIKRKTLLKSKEWEYECKVAALRKKLDQRRGMNDDTSEVVRKDLSMENTDVPADVATSEQSKHEGKEASNNSTEKVVHEKEDDKEENSVPSKNSAVLLGTRSSSRIKCRQKQALENADMSTFFERVQMKLGDVEEVEVGYGHVATYITDSSDEEWEQILDEHVANKLQRLRKELSNVDQSSSDSDSIPTEPDNEEDVTYSPDKDTEPNKYIKVVANPQLWKEEYRKMKKLYLDVKLEDYPAMWERKLFTSNLRQVRNVAVESKSYEEYRCMLCTGHHAFHTSAADLMESHLEEHLNSNFPCKECTATFDLQNLLTEHCIKEHSVTCGICNQEFSSQGLYKRHVGRMHGQRSFPCFKCNEKFKNKLQFKQHLLDAHPGSAHKCEKCGVILRSHLNAMQGHQNSKNCLRRQQGNLKTQCEICGKLVSENGIRKHRQRVHQKLRTFKCDVCSYAGITLQALKDHKKTHTGEHPVKCTMCDFSCIKPYQLKCHMRTHLKLKPYKCDKCSYAASWNVQVKDHMRAHFSPTRVDCVECKIAYKDQRGLNLHRHKEHGEGLRAKKDKTKNISSKKRGRPTRSKEGEVKTKNRHGARTRKTEEPSSEEDEYMDSDAELQNELSEGEEKVIPRKSTRRRATKQPDPQYEQSSEEDEDEYDSEEQEQADSYVPSVSNLIQ